MKKSIKNRQVIKKAARVYMNKYINKYLDGINGGECNKWCGDDGCGWHSGASGVSIGKYPLLRTTTTTTSTTNKFTTFLSPYSWSKKNNWDNHTILEVSAFPKHFKNNEKSCNSFCNIVIAIRAKIKSPKFNFFMIPRHHSRLQSLQSRA